MFLLTVQYFKDYIRDLCFDLLNRISTSKVLIKMLKLKAADSPTLAVILSYKFVPVVLHSSMLHDTSIHLYVYILSHGLRLCLKSICTTSYCNHATAYALHQIIFLNFVHLYKYLISDRTLS